MLPTCPTHCAFYCITMVDLKISTMDRFSITMAIATVMVAIIHVLIMYCSIAPFDMIHPQTHTIALKESHSCSSFMQKPHSSQWIQTASVVRVISNSRPQHLIQTPPTMDSRLSNDCQNNSCTCSCEVVQVLLSLHFHRVDVSEVAFEPSERSSHRLWPIVCGSHR